MRCAQASKQKRALGLRFLLASMTASGLTYPPSEESFVAKLREWASSPSPDLDRSFTPLSTFSDHLKHASLPLIPTPSPPPPDNMVENI